MYIRLYDTNKNKIVNSHSTKSKPLNVVPYNNIGREGQSLPYNVFFKAVFMVLFTTFRNELFPNIQRTRIHH